MTHVFGDRPTRQPFLTGRQPCWLQRICPDASGLAVSDCTCFRTSGLRSGSRRTAAGLSRFFSHSLLSFRKRPAPQVILTHVSLLALKPWLHTNGQMRTCLALMASSASRLASFVSSFIPAYLLNSSSELRAEGVQAMSASSMWCVGNRPFPSLKLSHNQTDPMPKVQKWTYPAIGFMRKLASWPSDPKRDGCCSGRSGTRASPLRVPPHYPKFGYWPPSIRSLSN